MQGGEELHNPFACLAVQVPGWLVGQKQGGLDGQSPGNGYTLHLSARKLSGPVADFLFESNLAEKLQALFAAHSPPYAFIDQGQFNVFEHIVLQDKIEGLEDKAKPSVTKPGEFRIAQRFDRSAI
jgi:hypothetical protein